MSKARGSDDELCYLICLKRNRARKAMSTILKGFEQIPGTGPSVCTLLDYLSDMVPALELMLKLLSGNRDNHDVGKMYQEVFTQPHADPDFMSCLKQALRDQKYLLEPSPNQPGNGGKKSIAEYIPEMEALFDELQGKIVDRYPTAHVRKRVILPSSFGDFLRRNMGRFYNGERFQMIELYLQNPNGVENSARVQSLSCARSRCLLGQRLS